MHELSIAKDIVAIAETNLAQYPGAKVTGITVSIGVFSGVDPEALKFCFPLATEGTSVEGSKLSIDVLPLKVTCNECGNGPMSNTSLKCPVCGAIDITVESGLDMTVSSIDLDTPDNPEEEREPA